MQKLVLQSMSQISNQLNIYDIENIVFRELVLRILLLSRYMQNGASSRVRFYQYLPYLRSQGIEITVAPLLGNGYIEHIYANNNVPFMIILWGYIKRILLLARAQKFDLIWIEKELFPWLPSLVENILTSLHIPYVVDYDDAIFHPYDLHNNAIVRTFLGQKIDKIMRQASLVIVGNDYLGQRASKSGAKRIELIPSVVDQHKWMPKAATNSGFRIGWIGSPVSAHYLRLIQKPLQILCEDSDTTMVLIGAGDHDYLPGIRKEILPWSEETEAAGVNSFDVGIMPLTEGPFEEGKCGYKLIQYMACSLPVVASPVGVNKQIVESNVTGFLASNNDEWINRLIELRNDPEKRNKLGGAGRAKLEKYYRMFRGR